VRTLRVLLVEDDEDHVFLIRRALADLAGVAVAVEVAADGEQALERLARARFEAGGLPQLVLLDLKMPRMGASRCSATSAPTRSPGTCRWWC
jgi:CheY-like chemotaxis protein